MASASVRVLRRALSTRAGLAARAPPLRALLEARVWLGMERIDIVAVGALPLPRAENQDDIALVTIVAASTRQRLIRLPSLPYIACKPGALRPAFKARRRRSDLELLGGGRVARLEVVDLPVQPRG